jgi:GT2 family glycosyltransferase
LRILISEHLPVSIIIVNYHSAGFISNCIESALQFASAKNFEWIIADNDSKDNSKEIITSKFPFVKWIDMGYNAGFARANNEGIGQSKNEIILLLNPDTIILDDAIEKCYQKFIQTDHVACGVQMLNVDMTPQISGSYFAKGGLNHLLPLPYWGDFIKWIALKMNVRKTPIEKAKTEEFVDWVSGAFLMVKKKAIQKAGLMDEDFFLYSEEVEWCSRLKKTGPLCLYGDINIIHILGEIIQDATQSKDKGYFNLYDRKGLQLIVSNHLRIRKQYGVGWFLFQLLNYTFAVPVFFICSFFNRLVLLKNPFDDWKKIKALAKNVFIVWKLAPTIIRNKPHFYKMI